MTSQELKDLPLHTKFYRLKEDYELRVETRNMPRNDDGSHYYLIAWKSPAGCDGAGETVRVYFDQAHEYALTPQLPEPVGYRRKYGPMENV